MKAVPEVHFRPEQRQIIEGYRGGKIGVSAVPGSGKTFTLSHLAARLVSGLSAKSLADQQEVLIVTFTNTAVNSFRSRIADILQQERGLLPYVGYRVRTLHGLAHDIVRERPALAGLVEDFDIVDERVAQGILRDVAQSLFRIHLADFAGFANPEAAASAKQMQRIESQELPELAADIARQFVKHAKDNLITPETLRARLAASSLDLPLVQFGLAVYEDYQRSLSYRGAVDFDDLVRLAILTLQTDEQYCARLRKRWPYILEDEAQDSSHLQEQMLRLLSGNENWVRVGDPNQAINTTFTTADPRYLRAFLQEQGVRAAPLSTSGRSVQPIIDVANFLVRWTVHNHPVPELRDSFYPQEIQPTTRDDPQPNPPARNMTLHMHYTPGENVSPDLELNLVATSLERFLQEKPDYTVAALVPENSRGYNLTEVLQARGIDYEELLRSTTATRESATLLYFTLEYLGDPLNVRLLARLYRDVWWPWLRTLDGDDDLRDGVVQTVGKARQVEEFLWPSPGRDWLEAVAERADNQAVVADLDAFRTQVRHWLQAAVLPIDQLILTLTQKLFVAPAALALGHKIAVVLRGLGRSNPHWRLPEFAEELRMISENQRKFLGFDDAEQGYEPRPGRVTVATMHAAKGLEWDRVYLLAVSNYGFPSAQIYDNYFAEKWFVRDNLNLEAEALAQLDALLKDRAYYEGDASMQMRLSYAAERLRLLYVGMTRARRDLIITWNMGRFWQKGTAFQNRPALPLVAMAEYLNGTLTV